MLRRWWRVDRGLHSGLVGFDRYCSRLSETGADRSEDLSVATCLFSGYFDVKVATEL